MSRPCVFRQIGALILGFAAMALTYGVMNDDFRLPGAASLIFVAASSVGVLLATVLRRKKQNRRNGER